MRARLSILTTIPLALSIAACAGPERRLERDIPETTANDCTFFRTLYDWRALDDTNMIVWGPSRQPYHVTLNSPSHDLRFVDSLLFIDDNNDGQLCGYGMDAVVIPGAVPDRITIGGMRQLDDQQLALLLGENEDTLGKVNDNATAEDKTGAG